MKKKNRKTIKLSIQAFPYPSEHAARLVSPERFEKFARKEVASGISMILGIREGKSIAQAYRFAKDKFSEEQAKVWLKEHNIKFISFEPAAEKKTQSFRRNIRLILNQIHAFSQNEILEMIEPDVLAEIKQNDPHPYFQAYIIAHEGTSQPRIIGEQSRPITWTKRAIQSIKNAIKTGIKFFAGHNEDSSHTGRKEIGKTVATKEMEIDGKLSSVVIGYYPPETKAEAEKYDVCSQESVWSFIDAGKRLIANKLHEMTGIALGNSSMDIPAFAGAKRIGFVQAFGDTKTENGGESKMEITIQDVQRFVREHNVWAWQLYDIETLKKDREFGDVIKRGLTVDEEIKKVKDGLEKEKKDLEEKITALTRESQKITIKQRLTKLIDSQETKLTDKQRQWVEKNLKDDIPDMTDEGLTKYLTDQMASFKTAASIFGVNFENDPKNPSGDGKTSGEIDYTDPAQNELLG